MSDIDLADGTRESMARTAQQYDQLQYELKPFPHSQPARLAGIAQYFGLEAAPLATARVLELGGAAGGNIIPHALRYPNAEFVGVDLGRAQIEAGQARVERLGLTNVSLRCESLTEVDESWGSFDYIICHGVYSWVPPFVQDAIFRVIRERLSPVGIGCVSFNVLPGWRMFQVFRDAFLFKVPEHGSPTDRVAAARDLLRFMSSQASDPGPYGDLVRLWGERLAGAPDYYLGHEYLEEVNAPTTIREFVAAANRHDLGYLSDCDISTAVSDNYGPEADDYIRSHSEDIVETEQYGDLLSGRTFRQALLVASARLGQVNRDTAPQSLIGRTFLIRDAVTIEQEDDHYVVRDPGGAWVSIPTREAAEAVVRLIEHHPSSFTFEDCFDPATGVIRDADRAVLLQTLHRMLRSYILTLTSDPVRAAAVSDKPRATALARADAANGSQTTTNLRHELTKLEPAMCALLPAMDGTLDRAALGLLLEREALAGHVAFTRDDVAVTDPDAIRQMVEDQLSAALASLARLALLEE